MEIKKMSAVGIAFLAQEEGIVLHPYLDPVGIPTIGIGCTYYENGARVKMSDPKITKARAIELFKTILELYEKTVWSITSDDINQRQFDALVSLCYNIGVAGFKGSTVLRLVNKDHKSAGIKNAFELWRNSGSKKGLLLPRRKREVKLYFS